jgi:hypothetical protein
MYYNRAHPKWLILGIVFLLMSFSGDAQTKEFLNTWKEQAFPTDSTTISNKQNGIVSDTIDFCGLTFFQRKDGKSFGHFYTQFDASGKLDVVGKFEPHHPSLFTDTLYDFKRNGELQLKEVFELGIEKRSFNNLTYNNGDGFLAIVQPDHTTKKIIICPSGSKIIVEPGTFDKEAQIVVREAHTIKEKILHGLTDRASLIEQRRGYMLDCEGIIFIDVNQPLKKPLIIQIPQKQNDQHSALRPKPRAYQGSCLSKAQEFRWLWDKSIDVSIVGTEYFEFKVSKIGWFSVAREAYKFEHCNVSMIAPKPCDDDLNLKWKILKKRNLYKGMPISGFIIHKKPNLIAKLSFSTPNEYYSNEYYHRIPQLDEVNYSEDDMFTIIIIVKHPTENKYYLFKKDDMNAFKLKVKNKYFKLVTPETLKSALDDFNN